jgi:hypothetical protein
MTMPAGSLNRDAIRRQGDTQEAAMPKCNDVVSAMKGFHFTPQEIDEITSTVVSQLAREQPKTHRLGEIHPDNPIWREYERRQRRYAAEVAERYQRP